jgi:4a-hydroxytetrahydrobiopterin dehydratase
MIHCLNDVERNEALLLLAPWTYDANRAAIYRRIACLDFTRAFALMTQIAFEADERNHHPEWSNIYNIIDIWLTTHDANGVSTQDIEMAHAIEGMIEPLSNSVALSQKTGWKPVT